MMVYLNGALGFFIDPTSDCLTKGYVVSIDSYEPLVTMSGTVPFATPNTMVKCRLRVCQTLINSLDVSQTY